MGGDLEGCKALKSVGTSLSGPEGAASESELRRVGSAPKRRSSATIAERPAGEWRVEEEEEKMLNEKEEKEEDG